MKPPTKFKPTWETSKWNIVRGDFVRVIQGPQTGQQGKVMQVLREKNRVLIEGVNMVREINNHRSNFNICIFGIIMFLLLFFIFVCSDGEMLRLKWTGHRGK